MGFIGGTADKPAPITDREADAILRRVADSGDKPKPKTLFEPGETVRVIDGPFADFNGVVEEVNYEKSRIQVAVLIFGRSTPVELEFSQVEKVWLKTHPSPAAQGCGFCRHWDKRESNRGAFRRLYPNLGSKWLRKSRLISSCK